MRQQRQQVKELLEMEGQQLTDTLMQCCISALPAMMMVGFCWHVSGRCSLSPQSTAQMILHDSYTVDKAARVNSF